MRVAIGGEGLGVGNRAQVCARTLSNLEQPSVLQDADGFAKRRPTNAQFRDKDKLGWELVADLEVAGTDAQAQLLNDLIYELRTPYWTKASSRFHRLCNPIYKIALQSIDLHLSYKAGPT